MSDVNQAAEETPEPERKQPLTVVKTLRVGESVLEYADKRRISGCAIRGMRDKPIRLRRVFLEKLMTFGNVRSLPQFYAVEFTKKQIHFWPAAVRDYYILISYGDTSEEPEDARP